MKSVYHSTIQIIHRCCAEIDLGAIFDGDNNAAMTILNESRACGVEWKVRAGFLYRSGTSTAHFSSPRLSTRRRNSTLESDQFGIIIWQ